MTGEVLQTVSSGSGFAQSSSTLDHDESLINPHLVKKKRNLPGNPDPEAEVIALSPKTLMATNRFLCEVCGKGFQRDQNLQLHRRGHNLPWKLKQRTSKEVRKRVYVCPEKTCVHHHSSRALGDLTGIKKHFCRKHGEKKWKCEKCAKRYAVHSDYKAHSKTCGTREYRCDCGTIFSRRDSFITHRAFCDALAEETAKINAASHLNGLAAAGAAGINLNYQYLMGTLNPPLQPFVPQPPTNQNNNHHHFLPLPPSSSFSLSLWMGQDIAPPQTQPQDYDWVFGNAKAASATCINNNNHDELITQNANATSTTTTATNSLSVPCLFSSDQTQNANANANMSATALLQKAAEIGANSSTTAMTTDPSTILQSFPLKSSDQTATYDSGEKFFALFGSNNNIGLMNHSHDQEIENARNDVTVASALDELQNYPWKRRRVDGGGEGGGGGQTRDFLGVGVQTLCPHPSSINGWI
ncbi:LOW QUALITY PROTEIN: zinc finger protein NUTCRACKER [Eutrema salsugineum]|uniref:LOW QUALITY PROTEIN: zinc finger protein NUTCRACKER n=1 Tax=Eutrema salsugineum TaxID=72664 RepID=UPI000CECE715|nr:LOW QUALITY PROTEIN: zinc finger protein NUTCRACKER [Eutrema salsugineum]